MMDIVEELFASDAANALTNRAAREIERLRDEVRKHESASLIARIKLERIKVVIEDEPKEGE